MTKKDLQKINDSLDIAVAKAIETYVNGGIRSLTKKMDDHIAEDSEWKKKAEPMIKLFDENEITSIQVKKKFGTVVFYAGGLSAIGAFLYGVWLVVKFIIMK